MTELYWNYDAKPCRCCGHIHDGAQLNELPQAAPITIRVDEAKWWIGTIQRNGATLTREQVKRIVQLSAALAAGKKEFEENENQK